jgi:Flp pilus assembly pilin Flp
LVEYALLLALIFAVLIVCVNIIGAQTSNGLDDAGSQGFVATSPN